MLAAMSFGGGMSIVGRIGMRVSGAMRCILHMLFGRCSRFLGVSLRYHQVRSRKIRSTGRGRTRTRSRECLPAAKDR
jgi:uncharacterized membrane protein YgcG